MKAEKQLLLDEIASHFDECPSFVVTRYSNLTANKAGEFRKLLANAGGYFEVVPKRVFLKAAESRGMQFDIEAMPGHIGVVFTTCDLANTTKAVLQYSTENEDLFELLCGRVDGEVVHRQDVAILAELPSRPVMQAALLGLFSQPLAQFLSVCEHVLSGVVTCLESKAGEANPSSEGQG